MNDPEHPFDDLPSGDGEPPYEWLDEWLCEYVDGAMDPSLETVFEQYVDANPKLKAHVERLRKTREMLCNCAPETVPNDTKQPPQDEDDRIPSPPHPAARESIVAHSLGPSGVVSSVIIALAIGFLAGTAFGSLSLSPAPLDLSAASQEVPQEAPGAPDWTEAPRLSDAPQRSAFPLSVADSTQPLPITMTSTP